MNLIKNLKKINYFNLINIYKEEIRKKLYFKYYNKKRTKLRNSYLSDTLLKEFFKKTLNYKKFRKIFFNKNFFAYSNRNEEKRIIEILNQNCSEEIEEYINYANKILMKEFSIFEKVYKPDNRINWHHSFFDNFTWKFDKSENIEIYPKNRKVDVKYVWEFNRHQFLTYLGFAYYYTNNEDYARAFKLIILDGIKSNPPLCGINWFSGLEISIRLINWIFTLYFFKKSIEINNNDFFKEIFISMFQHVYFLVHFYTHRSFNHTIGEIFGMHLFLKIFEEIVPIKRLEKKFFKKFETQILLQTRLDGTNIEQSINYHKFDLEFFSLFNIINYNNIKKECKYLIEKMFNYLLHAIKPNGTIPLIGDSDDGKVLLLMFHKNNNFIELINLASILFQRGDYKFISKAISPISILLLGANGYNTYQNIKEKEPPKKFEFFENAGYFIIRNNWTDKANYLFIDYGRFGPQMAPHSHSGITNFLFTHEGNDIIIDSGTYSYNKSWNERNLYRSSKAHNILVIDQKNQAKELSWFSWENKPKVKRSLKIDDQQIKFNCFHDGFKGFIVRREINTFMDLNVVIIKDSVIQTKKSSKNTVHAIDLYFHLNNNVKVKFENNHAILNNKLLLRVTSKHYFTMKIKNSFFSPKYGFKVKNKVLNIHLKHSFENNQKLDIETEIRPIKSR